MAHNEYLDQRKLIMDSTAGDMLHQVSGKVCSIGLYKPHSSIFTLYVGCFRAQEFNSSVCTGGSGSGMNLTEPMGDSRRKRDAGDYMMEDNALHPLGFRMQRDIVDFVRMCLISRIHM